MEYPLGLVLGPNATLMGGGREWSMYVRGTTGQGRTMLRRGCPRADLCGEAVERIPTWQADKGWQSVYCQPSFRSLPGLPVLGFELGVDHVVAAALALDLGFLARAGLRTLGTLLGAGSRLFLGCFLVEGLAQFLGGIVEVVNRPANRGGVLALGGFLQDR